MKIEGIKKGGKYYKPQSKSQSRKKITVVTGIPVYVLEVDLKKQQVFGSLNGGPPKWFTGNEFCRWKKEDPSQIKTRK